MQFGSQLLLIDARPSGDFAEHHVRSATNLDAALVSSDPDGFLANEKQNTRLWHRRSNNVIVYDAGANDTRAGDIAKALQAERRTSSAIRVLTGGLEAFEARYPFMVTDTPQFFDAEFPSEVSAAAISVHVDSYID